MASFKLVARFAIVTLLLVVHEPSSKLASGQLEAVGALMSVVPVTSILATAGLVGVKLVALSRLLDVLGYDRAYLAQGGSGTAAQPIGLQTKYAYMFPYVPGLNISVSGEDSIGMREPALESKSTESHRKTYPAMGLPGDYEKVQRPFRGSEALQDVFKQAGIKAHFPTPQQQQQIQQQFNVPPQEPTHTDKHLNDNNTNQNQQPPETLPPPPPPPPPPQPKPPQPQQQPHNSPPSPHVVPSNVVAGHREPNIVHEQQQQHQSANGQSSLNSQSHQVPASHHQHQQHQADAVAQM